MQDNEQREVVVARKRGGNKTLSQKIKESPLSLVPQEPEPTLEPEAVEAEAVSEIPFDPDSIQIKILTPTVDLILSRLKRGKLDVSPDFQRNLGIWTKKVKSRLCESLLMNFPLPAFYMLEGQENELIVIDGIQRISAIKEVVVDGMKFSGLEFLKEYEGRTFEALPDDLKTRFLESTLCMYVIQKGTPEAAKLNLFKRINTGGTTLNAQEIRHAANPGPVRALLNRLVQSEEFQYFGINNKRMAGEECISRYIAFFLQPLEEYTGDLGAFISRGLQRANELKAEEREELGARFLRIMRLAKRLSGEKAFRKQGTQRKQPVNKALFEAWAVNLSLLDNEQLAGLKARKALLNSSFIKLLKGCPELEASISGGIGDVRKVRTRFEKVAALFQQVLQGPEDLAPRVQEATEPTEEPLPE